VPRKSAVRIEKRKGIPILLERSVPECTPGVAMFLGMSSDEFMADDSAWFDLYDFLAEPFFREVLLPELLKEHEYRNADLVGRCFEFIESVISSPVESISAAGYFQTIEPLFASEGLLVASSPAMGPEVRRVVIAGLDPSRVSEGALTSMFREVPSAC
jgi:hypothetical protein